MQSAETVLTAFTVAAGLSLGVERSLEILKQFIDFGSGSLNPKERAESMKRAADLIDKAEAALANPVARTAPSAKAKEAPAGDATQELPLRGETAQPAIAAVAPEKHPPPRIPVIEMTPLSTQNTANALLFQFAAAGLGFILANILELRLISLLLEETKNANGLFRLADTLLTGLVIGGGSQPIHVLIRFLTERKITAPSEEAVKDVGREVEKTRALAKVVSTSSLVEEKKEPQALAWIDIPYQGGVFPDRLETQHLRSGKPSLIVYHHTAMSSVSSFQNVVDEFLVAKKWLTGYNCVIMPDGAIKPFCRWDRYGNHAGALNDRSLGLSFHGNFHTLPEPYSNADGRFGNQQPTEAQLHAGARVVALWVYLYGIELDFQKRILAHREAMPGHTVCPGSNFPYEPFKKLVRQYHDAWSHSDSAQKGIAAFRQLRYVTV